MKDSDYIPVNRKSDLILLLSGVVGFFIFIIFFSAEKALAFSVVAGVFLSIIQTKPKKQRDRRFWGMILVLAMAHIVFLSLVHISELKFGLMLLPVAVVDGFVIWWLISWIQRRFPAACRSGSED